MEKHSILIADDEINLCRILEAEFKKAGYSVIAVHNGSEAVERVRHSEFCLILLDVRMPMLDGLSALREIRKTAEDVPVIIMTAYESHDTTASALSMGATACVSKPFDLESLVALVRATLAGEDGDSSASPSLSVRTVLFSKNQPILLEVHEGEYTGQYESTIKGKDDQTLTISRPQVDGMSFSLGAGAPVSIGFAGEDAFYSFETAVLANREGSTPTMIVGKPAVIYRIQRRKYPRMLARIPVELAEVEDSRQNGAKRRVLGCTEDIGAGGFRMVADAELPDGTEVEVRTVDQLGLTSFCGTGRITRICKSSANSAVKWEYGVQFTKVDEKTRCALREMVEAGAVA